MRFRPRIFLTIKILDGLTRLANSDGSGEKSEHRSEATEGEPAHIRNDTGAAGQPEATSPKPDRTKNDKDWRDYFRDLKVTDILLAAFTGLLVVVGIFQWCVISRTDDALHKVSAAADTANQQNATANRAFVTVDGLEIKPRVSSDGTISMWSVKPIIVNSGNTSTVAAEFYTEELTFPSGQRQFPIVPRPSGEPYDPDDRFTNPVFDKFYHKQAGFLGPKTRYAFRGFWLGKPLLDRLATFPNNDLAVQTDTRIFIVGSIHYTEQFEPGVIKRTKFCFELGADQSVVGHFEPAYWQCERWNCADEGCK
jgi:hypothetical protein